MTEKILAQEWLEQKGARIAEGDAAWHLDCAGDRQAGFAAVSISGMFVFHVVFTGGDWGSRAYLTARSAGRPRLRIFSGIF